MNKFYLTSICLLALFQFYPSTLYGQKEVSSADTLRNVRLREIIVTATQPDAPGTRSLIGPNAIRHIQATDLSGLSQLLPGVITRNPNLNVPAFFSIRSATYENATNTLGTAILVDGLRMNNNINMQQIGLEGRGSLFNSSALAGFDVRSISPASIESVEVIRGVPSARYGDVTNGVVSVKSKAGLQPFSAGLRFTATEKLVFIGKGMAVGTNAGILFLGADYALSRQAPQLPEQSFQRIGIQAAYAKDFPTASLRFHVRGSWMQDRDKRGKNTIEGEFRKYLNRSIACSVNGQWELKKTWITNLEYQAGWNYGRQRNESSIYYSGTQQVTTYSTQEGEHAGIFLAPNYFTRLSVDGKPLSADASLTANLLHATSNKKVYNHLLLGIEAGTEGNRGEGIRFDPLRPPLEMLRVRTRSYRSIPFLYHYAAFGENKITLRTGKMSTELQAGIRISQPITRALRYAPSVDPRLNVRQIWMEREDDAFLNRISIRLGWGMMHKMPVLAYLYPDRSYTDENCFTYNDEENGKQLTVMHTFATGRTFNPQLRLPVNRKLELGINLRLGMIRADVVWFREHLRNGFCTTRQAEPFTYRRYETLTGKGEQPELTDNGILNNGHALAYTSNTTFATYARPENGIEQNKQGVEYTLGPVRWERLRSSLLISGGYLEESEKNAALSALHPQIELNGKPYPYTGIYEAASFACNLRVWQQLNTRFQCTTQLPRIGLITTLTLQAVWIAKQRRGMESRYDSPVYLADDNGNRIPGDPMTDTEHRKRLNPVFYLDGQGNRHPFTPEMATDKRFSDLVIDAATPTAFLTDAYKPYFLINLRMTKEIGRHVSVAFCANNLTQSNPKRYSRSTRQYSILNPDLYYGAEVNIRF